MDRRQQKTREAIFQAFTTLLSKKHYNQITVQEIIDLANVGRTTFYAHFETKDYLLRDYCEDLCDHIIETAHGHISDSHGAAAQSIYLHLLLHFQENNHNILDLLASPNNEIFLRFFKKNLHTLIRLQYEGTDLLKVCDLPEEYVINHITTSFVETVYWWISHKMKESPETVEAYFQKTLAFLYEDCSQSERAGKGGCPNCA